MSRQVKKNLLLAGGSLGVALLRIGAFQLPRGAGPQGPKDQGTPLPQDITGDRTLGRDVFRFETFGNEGFWTDAVRLPAGIMAAKVTPMQALELGLQVDVDAVDPATKAKLAAELKADPSGQTSSVLNDPNVTPKLVMANAVMGMSAVAGKVGTSCALCHSMSDASVFKSPHGGSIGHRLDGLLPPRSLDVWTRLQPLLTTTTSVASLGRRGSAHLPTHHSPGFSGYSVLSGTSRC